MNFCVNVDNGNCFFEEPDRIVGSVSIPDPAGGLFSVEYGIIPPRLNKTYDQHPGAETILATGRPFAPRIVTFWGVGLTDSDVDLLDVYREATRSSDLIEFINPSITAHEKATELLAREIVGFCDLDTWLQSTAMP